MNKGPIYRTFVYFLCFSFLILTSGFPRLVAEAKERRIPVGEMVSSGEVTFEARENVWKKVEPCHFPVFEGVKIKTKKGRAFISLTNDIQVEVGPNVFLSLQKDRQLHLIEGEISFRIPTGGDISFRVGNLSIMKPLPMLSARALVPVPKTVESIGSLTVRPSGAVTVTSLRGPLSIQNTDRVVLAQLASKESITIPRATAFGRKGQMRAQAREIGQYPTGKAALDEPLLGLSDWTWMVISLAAVGVGGAGIGLAASDSGDDDSVIPFIPICP